MSDNRLLGLFYLEPTDLVIDPHPIVEVWLKSQKLVRSRLEIELKLEQAVVLAGVNLVLHRLTTIRKLTTLFKPPTTANLADPV
jgi:hypothetical protein